MIDWKRMLTDSGVVLSIAEMARDQIAGKINKELEHQLEEAKNEVMTLKMDLQRAKLDLRNSLEDNNRLNLVISDLRAAVEKQ